MFVEAARRNADTATAVQVAEHVVSLSRSSATPVFVTYEGSSKGDHAMPGSLLSALPRWQQTFIKTRYAATALAPLREALKASGVTHLVLMGSETDVCVLLTALGLRQLGYEVLLVRDGVFSSDRNVEPALERMHRAGVRVGDHRDAERMISGKPLPAAVSQWRQQRLIINAIKGDAKSVALIVSSEVPTNDPADGCSTAARVQRFRELLLLAEWLRLPVYVNGEVENHVTWARQALGFAALDDRLVRKSLRPLETLDAAKYDHLVIAGSDQDFPGKLTQIGAPRRIIAVTDAMFTTAEPDGETPNGNGFVPTTYKTFYREVTGSVSYNDWPDAAWVSRLEQFQPLMMDPEALAPVETDCQPEVGHSPTQVQ